MAVNHMEVSTFDNKKTIEVPIAMAHVVSNPTFENHIDELLANRHTFISPDELHWWQQGIYELPDKPFLYTFDDGTIDHYDVAYPVLQSRGVKATMYIISDRVGTAGYITWAQAKEMADSGLITIGNHTKTHDYTGTFNDMTEAEWITEIKDCTDAVHTNVGHPCYHFAYPGGKYTPTTLKVLKDLGMLTGRTVTQGSFGFSDTGSWETCKINTPQYEIPVKFTTVQLEPTIPHIGRPLTPMSLFNEPYEIQGWDYDSVWGVVAEGENGTNCIKFTPTVTATRTFRTNRKMPLRQGLYVFNCRLKYEYTSQANSNFSSIEIYEYDNDDSFLRSVKLMDMNEQNKDWYTERKLYEPSEDVKSIQLNFIGYRDTSLVWARDFYLKQVK